MSCYYVKLYAYAAAFEQTPDARARNTDAYAYEVRVTDSGASAPSFDMLVAHASSGAGVAPQRCALA